MDQNLQKVWEKCLLFMRDNLNASEGNDDLKKLEKSFDLLFDKVEPVSLINHNLTLLVPSDFYKEYIEDNYLSLLSAALKKNIGRGVKLWYSVMENKPKGQEKPITQRVKGISTQQPKVQEVMPVPNKVLNPFVIPGIKKVNIESNLKADFSFDNYIEGESNKFAATVARSIAKRPGATAFNPLFLYGGYGVGKTHLCQAVGLEVKNLFPDKVVLYLSSEKFIQQFIQAAKAQNKTDFQNFYQMVDVLIIDDIQFFGGKSRTQEEFFYAFEALIAAKKAPGVGTYGNILATLTDRAGIPHPIRFSRPALRPIAWYVTVRPKMGYTLDVENRIKAALAAYTNGIAIGANQELAAAYPAANLTGTTDAARFEIVGLAARRADLTSDAYGDVAAAYNEALTCVPADVTVTTV